MDVELVESASSPVLEYAHGDTIAGERLGWRMIRCAALLPGIIVPFISFTYSISPAHAIATVWYELVVERSPEAYDWLFVLAVGLSWQLVAWIFAARLLLPLRATVWECRVFIALAVLLAAAGLAFCCWGSGTSLRDRTTLSTEEWAAFVASPCVLAVVIPLLILRWRSLSLTRLAMVCQQAAYLSVASIALIAFTEDRDPGWWMTAGLCGYALAELVLALRPGGR
jgi:hypothetical protein